MTWRSVPSSARISGVEPHDQGQESLPRIVEARAETTKSQAYSPSGDRGKLHDHPRRLSEIRPRLGKRPRRLDFVSRGGLMMDIRKTLETIDGYQIALATPEYPVFSVRDKQYLLHPGPLVPHAQRYG